MKNNTYLKCFYKMGFENRYKLRCSIKEKIYLKNEKNFEKYKQYKYLLHLLDLAEDTDITNKIICENVKEYKNKNKFNLWFSEYDKTLEAPTESIINGSYKAEIMLYKNKLSKYKYVVLSRLYISPILISRNFILHDCLLFIEKRDKLFEDETKYKNYIKSEKAYYQRYFNEDFPSFYSNLIINVFNTSSFESKYININELLYINNLPLRNYKIINED